MPITRNQAESRTTAKKDKKVQFITAATKTRASNRLSWQTTRSRDFRRFAEMRPPTTCANIERHQEENIAPILNPSTPWPLQH